MIVVRRFFALLLLPFLGVLFFVALFAGRVDATLLNPDFVLEHAREANLYEAIHDEGIPAWVDSYVAGQEERLPDNLRGANLPTDAEARARITEVVQTLVPPEFLEDVTEGILGGVLPYLAGKEPGFEVNVSLYEPLRETFGHAAGERSAFQDAWLDLDFSERLIRGFASNALDDEGDRAVIASTSGSDGPAATDEGDRPGLAAILAEDVEGAAAWWDRQFFGVIDAMLPYLLGDSPDFDVSIDFADYPALAYAFEGPLQTDAPTLERQGWAFSSTELRRRLAETDDLTQADIDNALALFRPGGATWTEDDLQVRIDEQRERAAAQGNPDDAPLDLQDQRSLVRNARLAATWGATLLVGLLVLIVAFLGGRGWTGRLRWGASAVLLASLLSLVITTPVYAVAASDRVDTWIEEQRADSESPLPEVVRHQVLDTLREVVSDFVGGMQWRAAGWFVLAALALALSFALERPGFREGIRRSVDRVRGPREAAPPPAA